MGLGRSRWCSWIVEIAGVGARRPSPDSESSRKGHDVGARRSDPARSTSFDEAAVEKDRVLPPKGARQRASAAGTRPSRWPKTPARGCAARRAFDREPAGPGRAGPMGNQGTSSAAPKLGTRRQARLHPRSRRSLRFGMASGRGSHPRTRKRTGTVIRESSGSPGARIVSSVAEIGTRYLPCQGKAHRKARSAATG